VLTVDGENFAQNLRVESDPVVTDAITADGESGMNEEEEEEERECEREQESGQTGPGL
jgi:hypothetical protein